MKLECKYNSLDLLQKPEHKDEGSYSRENKEMKAHVLAC